MITNVQGGTDENIELNSKEQINEAHATKNKMIKQQNRTPQHKQQSALFFYHVDNINIGGLIYKMRTQI